MNFFKRLRKPKARVALELSDSAVCIGDNLKGEINLSSQEEFDADEIRTELRCVERRRKERWIYNKRRKRDVRQVYWAEATLHSDNSKVAEHMHLVPGFKKTYSIDVNIPAGGRESFDGLDGSVIWSIKGVAAISGRPDVTSKTIELQVIKPSSGKKEETVMIACDYCESLMPQTVTSCPNCGAPRKT